jgi:capsular exopolysaccharide synthesis family protein
METSETQTTGGYARVLRAYRRSIVIITLVAAGLALLASLSQSPTYKATTTISVTSDLFPPAQAPPEQGQLTPPSVIAGLSLAKDDQVLRRVDSLIGAHESPDQLRSEITAIPQTFNPPLIDLTAEADTANGAAHKADAAAHALSAVATEKSRNYFRETANGNPEDEVKARTVEPVSILIPATVPSKAESPRPFRDVVLGAFLGFLLGTAIAFGRYALDKRIRNEQDAQRDLGLPLVGHIHSEAFGAPNGSELDGRSFGDDELEAFRILRTNVSYLAGEDGPGVAAVTSPLAGEGKSTVAAGYAYASALAGTRAILVECDFRRPSLAERFGLDPSPGLYDHLSGKAKPADVLRSIQVEGQPGSALPVIPAGIGAAQPAEMIASSDFQRFIRQISKAYDLVVIDCAPLLPVADALQILPLADVVLLCVRIGQTTHDQATAAKQAIRRLPERPTGLVATGIGRDDDEDYYSYYADPSTGAPVGA